jgi:hypothetical protein
MADILGATTGVIAAGASIMSGSYGNAGTALGLKLPAENILSKYASYDYIISLSALTIQDLNYPDTSYKAGKVLPLICKTGGADPNNRVATAYGKFDFYIDNLTFESIIGMSTAKATNVSTIQFDVYEPYSIGTFILSLQTAAYQAGSKNWRDASFLLTIEFRGNTETGGISKVPFSSRHIPIKFTTIGMKATEKGCKYSVMAYGTQSQALTTQYANLKTDTVVKGKTVQEVLQTGEQSLQAVVNKYLETFVKEEKVAVADKVVILFPKEEDLPSAGSKAAGASAENKKSATYKPEQVTSDAAAIFKKIGINQTNLTQSSGEVNILGSAPLGYSKGRPGDQAAGVEEELYDAATKTWKRGAMTVNIEEGLLKFSQDMDIPSVINQVLMQSSYPEKALGTLEKGMRTWWRIDTQVFYIDTDENLKYTGSYPRIVVYRVVPYMVHTSKDTAPNVQAPGFDAIKNAIVKRYDYIYTGKNTEVLNFNIDFSVGFSNVMAAADYSKSQGVQDSEANAKQDNKEDNKKIVDSKPGALPPTQAGASPSQRKNTGTNTSYSTAGGAQTGETAAQAAARVFHDAITNPNDMVVLEMDIWGDPYWIVNSGMGNYTSKQVPGIKDLNKDGSVNWQSSEVDIWVYFRSPVDINPATGLYDFKSPNVESLTQSSKDAPSIAFSGLYCVNRVTSTFRQGQFRQQLKGFRRPLQDPKTTTATNEQLANTKTPAPKVAGGDGTWSA